MKSRNIIYLLILFIILISFTSCGSKPKWEEYRDGTHLVLQVESKGDAKTDSINVQTIADILDGRLKALGIKKRIVKKIGGNQIAIQTPPVKNTPRLVKMMSLSTVLEFRVIEEKIKENELNNNAKHSNREILYQIEKDARTGQNIETPFVTETNNILQIGEHIKYADAKKDKNGNNFFVTIEMTKQGAKLFEEFTANHINRRVAIVLNNRIYSAPFVREKISGGWIQITGNFSYEEAQDLEIILMAGGYPAHTRLIENKNLTKEIWLGSVN